jgi:hypothetical protein
MQVNLNISRKISTTMVEIFQKERMPVFLPVRSRDKPTKTFLILFSTTKLWQLIQSQVRLQGKERYQHICLLRVEGGGDDKLHIGCHLTWKKREGKLLFRVRSNTVPSRMVADARQGSNPFNSIFR